MVDTLIFTHIFFCSGGLENYTYNKGAVYWR